MDGKTKNEIVGRLWLWAESVSKTKHLLEMSFRANVGKKDETRLLEQEIYMKNLNEFVVRQSDYKYGHVLSSQQSKFNEVYPREFPTWLECCAAHDAFVELAIVYFCQVFNLGKGQDSEAAKNDDAFRKEHLPKILSDIFPIIEERSKFDSLKAAILKSRDKVIGHSDAEAYSIKHASPISIMRGPNISWRDIDFEFWYSFLDSMINAIHNYSNVLKISK